MDCRVKPGKDGEKVDFNSIGTCASLLDVAAYKMIACRGTWPQQGATGFP
jgi:hypothetical protein